MLFCLPYLRHITGIRLLVNKSRRFLTSFSNILVLSSSVLSAPEIKTAPHFVPETHYPHLFKECYFIT